MTVMRTYIYWYTYLGFKQSKEKSRRFPRVVLIYSIREVKLISCTTLTDIISCGIPLKHVRKTSYNMCRKASVECVI